MNDWSSDIIPECSPAEAWAGLKEDGSAQLIDVRTRPEWAYVGVPDLSELGRSVHLIEWKRFPEMVVAEDFAERVFEAVGAPLPETLYFICRSGVRSLQAAQEVARVAAQNGEPVRCCNVSEGFEGDLDAHRHRGVVNGWKVRGLAWQQN